MPERNWLMMLVTVFSLFTALHGHGQSRDFESYLDGLVAAQFNDYQTAGMTFTLIEGGEIKLLKGYGVANFLTHSPGLEDRAAGRIA